METLKKKGRLQCAVAVPVLGNIRRKKGARSWRDSKRPPSEPFRLAKREDERGGIGGGGNLSQKKRDLCQKKGMVPKEAVGVRQRRQSQRKVSIMDVKY